MDAAQVIDLGRESLWIAVLVAAPLLGVALAAGLIVGIFQAATSIQEMTLSFIPKLAVMVLALLSLADVNRRHGRFFDEFLSVFQPCFCNGSFSIRDY